ncbi:DUF4416 family protein [Desulfosoma caldarium]|uniref:Uncharacterized protein DUF4416 n=1 Tax=Desulfosoma caldarium TaxID=610254 RepID=A0A3N1VFV5_9BACT|nr:DUF4416 family protein [Desulfosoma caldarium]ROR01755.1 uncharacterized protein DUF4416 [Desulfosoma caldarium]
MSVPKVFEPCKLVFGLLYRRHDDKTHVLSALTELFGPLDAVTQPQNFTFTRFYDKEMGSGLLRVFGSFDELVDPERLAEIKHRTNLLEQSWAQDGRRTINVDPGLLSEERLVLATGKNAAHRIPLRNGIYGDLSLLYRHGAYRPLPWTYPDYAQDDTRRFFGLLRGLLMARRSGRPPRPPQSFKEMPL